MKKYIRKERVWVIALAIVLILHYMNLIEKRNDSNWLTATVLFQNTSQIQSVSIYDYINNHEVTYVDIDEIEMVIEPYKCKEVSPSPRKAVVRNLELTYRIQVDISEDWADDIMFEVYQAANAVYLEEDQVSFEVSGNHYVLMFRNHICYINVITE